jgi:hypothetical protein
MKLTKIIDKIANALELSIKIIDSIGSSTKIK